MLGGTGRTNSASRRDVSPMNDDQTMQLVIVRHGESEWNKLNLFTGWTDVDLTDTGREEAHAGGKALKEAGYDFDVCYTSLLKRAIHTLNCVLDELDRNWLPVHKAWQLNERHYGALQGLNKADAAAGRRGEVVEACFKADEAFHDAVSAMCKNELIDKINRVVRVLTFAVRHKTVETMITSGRSREHIDVHWRIYEMLKSGSIDGIEDLIRHSYFLDIVKN